MNWKRTMASKPSRLPRILCIFVFFLAPMMALAADGPTTIGGIVFISPSGELESDLAMRAANIDVALLRDDETFESKLQSLRDSRVSMIDKQKQAVTRAQLDFYRSVDAPRQEQEKKNAVLRQERARLAEMRSAYEGEVRSLIDKHTIAKTKTDSEGNFTLADVSAGRYLVNGFFEIPAMGINYFWLFPVEVKGEKEVKIQLEKSNAKPFF